jgi:hypothetical protein
MNRRAFSFAEVMFAVAILGVGFVMVAAVFPLAAEQTRSNADEAVAACLSRDAISTIQNMTYATDYPDNGGITQAFADVTPLWNEVSTSAIDQADARYAWIPFFSKPTTNGLVRVTVLVVRRWIHDQYTSADLQGELIPRGISILSITPQADGTDVVTIARDYSGMYQCVAPGCFLIMRSGDGVVSGSTYRVGQYLNSSADAVLYSLIPGEGIAVGDTCGTASAAVIGKDFKDLSNPAAGYDGPAQDVAVYTTFIKPN